MIHLVASKSCLKVPRSVEDLLRSVGSHFNRNSVRQDKLNEFQGQYKVLKVYVKVEVFEDPSKILEVILITLNNKFTKTYLEFLSYVPEEFNDFNKLF